MPAPPAQIRPARPEDAALLVALIRELAVYEKLEAQAVATPADLASRGADLDAVFRDLTREAA